MNKDKTIAIVKRIAVEFGLPAIASTVWMMSEVGRSGAPAEYVKQFGAAFFVVGWVWGQLLRIEHQQGQREDIKALGTRLEEATGTMDKVKAATDVIMTQVAVPLPAEVRHLVSLARAATDQIENANVAYHAIASHGGVSKPTRGSASRVVPPPNVRNPGGFPLPRKQD